MILRLPVLSVSSRIAIFLIFLASSFFVTITYATEADASCTKMWDEWTMWDNGDCRATMILQPFSRNNYHSRSRIDANLNYLQSRGWGGNRNFVWYSNDVGLRVGSATAGKQWSYNWYGATKWIYVNDDFYTNTWLGVFEYNGTFISRVCGNFTSSTVNPPNPIISGSKWKADSTLKCNRLTGYQF